MKTALSYAHAYEGFRNAYARTLFLMLTAGFAITIILYGYFLKSAAFSGAHWEDDQMAIATLSSEVSELESAYLTRIQSLGMEEANILGLHETENPIFVERGGDTRLTFANSIQDGAR